MGAVLLRNTAVVRRPTALVTTIALVLTVGATRATALEQRATIQSLPAGISYLTGVACPKANECAAIGTTKKNEAIAIYTTDGGLSWSVSTSNPDWSHLGREFGGLIDLVCTPPTGCDALGGAGTPPLYSPNDGRHWTYSFSSWDKPPPRGLTNLYKVSCAQMVIDLCDIGCPTANHCVAVGQGSQLGPQGGPNGVVVYYTESAGRSWSDGRLPQSVSGMRSVSCFSATTCVGGGDVKVPGGYQGDALYSTNGGKTWSEGTVPHHLDAFTGIFCATSTDCVASATPDFLYTDSAGRTWTLSRLPKGVTVRDSPALLSCGSSKVCVTASSPMLFTVNGGVSWSVSTAPKGYPYGLYGGIACSSSHNCIDVGGSIGAGKSSSEYGLALYTVDGGMVWKVAKSAA
jgi:photosystem II stability/assembly factor-like uncharacterized protein